jgi:uncharacterized MAPEG superfamily protein
VADDVAAPRPASSAAEGATTSRAERAHASAYYTRFSFAYAILVMVAIAGVAALVLILVHLHTAKQPRWSTFVPTGSPLAMKLQIATQVSSEYKQSTASRLVTVFPSALDAPQIVQSSSGQQQAVQIPISLIAVRADSSTGQHEQGDFTFYHPESTVAYSMCGFVDSQQNCGVSTASAADPAGLFHREALELALYTLKYVPGVDAVVTYLPPPANPNAAATAVFIARTDVKPNLHLPLVRTLEPQQILLGSGVPDGGHVAALTRARVYTTDYQTLPGDGTAALELTPDTTG